MIVVSLLLDIYINLDIYRRNIINVFYYNYLLYSQKAVFYLYQHAITCTAHLPNVRIKFKQLEYDIETPYLLTITTEHSVEDLK